MAVNGHSTTLLQRDADEQKGHAFFLLVGCASHELGRAALKAQIYSSSSFLHAAVHRDSAGRRPGTNPPPPAALPAAIYRQLLPARPVRNHPSRLLPWSGELRRRAWRPRRRPSATSLALLETAITQELTALLVLSLPLRGGDTARQPWRCPRERQNRPPRWAISPVLTSQFFIRYLPSLFPTPCLALPTSTK
jgi:hypothetical protein